MTRRESRHRVRSSRRLPCASLPCASLSLSSIWRISASTSSCKNEVDTVFVEALSLCHHLCSRSRYLGRRTYENTIGAVHKMPWKATPQACACTPKPILCAFSAINIVTWLLRILSNTLSASARLFWVISHLGLRGMNASINPSCKIASKEENPNMNRQPPEAIKKREITLDEATAVHIIYKAPFYFMWLTTLDSTARTQDENIEALLSKAVRIRHAHRTKTRRCCQRSNIPCIFLRACPAMKAASIPKEIASSLQDTIPPRKASGATSAR